MVVHACQCPSPLTDPTLRISIRTQLKNGRTQNRNVAIQRQAAKKEARKIFVRSSSRGRNQSDHGGKGAHNKFDTTTTAKSDRTHINMTGTTDPPKASKLRSTPPAFSSLMDDCERPACDDMASMLRQAHSRSQTTAAAAAAAAASKETVTATEQVGCPPRTAELGKASWTLLHTMVRT
jgi:hypothetical protein